MNIRLLATSVSIAVLLGSPVWSQGSDAPKVEGFNGKIELDVRDSTPDWTPFTPQRAPEGAPNILFVLYDDTGLGAWSPYGGRINMPTLDKLAAEGNLRLLSEHRPGSRGSRGEHSGAVLQDPGECQGRG